MPFIPVQTSRVYLLYSATIGGTTNTTAGSLLSTSQRIMPGEGLLVVTSVLSKGTATSVQQGSGGGLANTNSIANTAVFADAVGILTNATATTDLFSANLALASASVYRQYLSTGAQTALTGNAGTQIVVAHYTAVPAQVQYFSTAWTWTGGNADSSLAITAYLYINANG